MSATAYGQFAPVRVALTPANGAGATATTLSEQQQQALLTRQLTAEAIRRSGIQPDFHGENALLDFTVRNHEGLVSQSRTALKEQEAHETFFKYLSSAPAKQQLTSNASARGNALPSALSAVPGRKYLNGGSVYLTTGRSFASILFLIWLLCVSCTMFGLGITYLAKGDSDTLFNTVLTVTLHPTVESFEVYLNETWLIFGNETLPEISKFNPRLSDMQYGRWSLWVVTITFGFLIGVLRALRIWSHCVKYVTGGGSAAAPIATALARSTKTNSDTSELSIRFFGDYWLPTEYGITYGIVTSTLLVVSGIWYLQVAWPVLVTVGVAVAVCATLLLVLRIRSVYARALVWALFVAVCVSWFVVQLHSVHKMDHAHNVTKSLVALVWTVGVLLYLAIPFILAFMVMFPSLHRRLDQSFESVKRADEDKVLRDYNYYLLTSVFLDICLTVAQVSFMVFLTYGLGKAEDGQLPANFVKDG